MRSTATAPTSGTRISDVWSRFGNTENVIGVCVLAVAIICGAPATAAGPSRRCSRSRCRRRSSCSPPGRSGGSGPRRIPMDASPPTSSFPSGHVGASTALYLVLAAARPAHRTARGCGGWSPSLCAVVPLLVAYARLYRGAHHITDVLVGHAQRRRLRPAGLRLAAPRREAPAPLRPARPGVARSGVGVTARAIPPDTTPTPGRRRAPATSR